MQEANKTMKATFKEVSIGDVENLYDEMEDLYETSNEIQEVLSRSYGMPDELDEADLEDELAALGDDLDWGEQETVPSYLQTSMPSTDSSALDEYGLPSVPSDQLETLGS